jgi:RHS repeat-associated protein
VLTQAYNPATNRRYSDVADANGNLYQNGGVAYDVENRVAEANGVKYAYSPDNMRIWRGSFSIDELTVYSMGQKLGAYNLSVNNGALVATCTGYYEYFGGKMIKNSGGYINQDRLGSRGKYFPYGQDRGSNPSNGSEKFATYTRDAETGLDYAQNRYHSSGDGRFLSPDPYQASAGPEDPGSWNRYSYVGGDPINYYDPSGLAKFCPDGNGCRAPVPPPANCPAEFWKAECAGVPGLQGPDDSCAMFPDHPLCNRQTPSEILVTRKYELIQDVENESKTDCEAMLAFATDAALLFHGNAEGFVQAMGNLVPNSSVPSWARPLLHHQISWSSTNEELQSSKRQSGFQSQYQDSIGANRDQAHHFAFYLQMGYFSPNAGYVAAFWSDLDNEGDRRLAQKALKMGIAIREGGTAGIYDALSGMGELCK